MTRIRVTCVHCDQLMEVRAEDANRELRCVRCRKTFRLPPSTSDSQNTGEDIQGVIAVACRECGETFGIRKAMQGKLVACPICKAIQIAVAGKGAAARPAAEKTDKKKPERSSVRKDPQPTPTKSVSTKSPRRDRSLGELLPPKYTVPAEVEQQVAVEDNPAAARGIELGIDTGRTRIQRGGEAIDVRSLSREEKSRRKRIRVGIVYAISILILVALLVVLIRQVSPGE